MAITKTQLLVITLVIKVMVTKTISLSLPSEERYLNIFKSHSGISNKLKQSDGYAAHSKIYFNSDGSRADKAAQPAREERRSEDLVTSKLTAIYKASLFSNEGRIILVNDIYD